MCNCMDESAILGKIALATIDITLGSASCDFPVAIQFFPKNALSFMRLPGLEKYQTHRRILVLTTSRPRTYSFTKQENKT